MSSHAPLVRGFLVVALLASSALAHAASWVALSGRAVSDAGRIGESFYPSVTTVFPAGGAVFEDGVYSPTFMTAILALPGSTSSAISFLAGAEGTAPPQIDLAQMRADFSALTWRGWDTEGRPVVGGAFKRPGWIDITANADGSYQATWAYAYSGVFPTTYGSTGVFTLTFASAVPEASAAVYLLGGLLALLWVRRGTGRPS